jgi:hypothetical protein
MRLSDDELDEIDRTRFPTHEGNPPASVLVRRMPTELRERRAQDLTSDEVEALRLALPDIASGFAVCDDDDCQASQCVRNRRVLAVLDRLITSHQDPG